MKKYKVLRNCHGFQRRYWTAGDIVELEDDAKPPHHFLEIKEDASPVKDPMAPVPVVLSTLASYQQVPEIKTGMAAGLTKSPPPIVGRKRAVKK